MFVIGLDLGTSAIKGVLFDSRKQEIAAEDSIQVEFITSGGKIEIDPECHYQSLCKILRNLAGKTDQKIAAVSMAVASGNTLLLDPDNGKAKSNIISWLDKRYIGKYSPLLSQLKSEEIRQLIGWPCIDIFPLAHLAYFRESQPELLDRAIISQNHAYLQFRLTNTHAIDYSSGTAFHLIDQEQRCYSQKLLKLFQIEERQLPELVDTNSIIGKLTPQAARDTNLSCDTLVVAGSFDHPAAARGVKVVNPGELLLSCGTSWVGFFPCESRQLAIDNHLLADPFLVKERNLWGAMFSIPQIGLNIERYVNEYIAKDEDNKMQIFDHLAAESSSNGLKIDLTEEFAMPTAPKGAVARAVMENAAWLLKNELEKLRNSGIIFNKAVMVGGASRSPVWPEIVAEVTNLAMTRGTRSAGALGAAMIAADGVKKIIVE